MTDFNFELFIGLRGFMLHCIADFIPDTFLMAWSFAFLTMLWLVDPWKVDIGRRVHGPPILAHFPEGSSRFNREGFLKNSERKPFSLCRSSPLLTSVTRRMPIIV